MKLGRLLSIHHIFWPRHTLMVSIFSISVTLDQTSKFLVQKYLVFGSSFPNDGIFRLTFVTNSGGAFGLFPNQTFALTIASFIGIFIILFLYRANYLAKGRLTHLSLGLLLGGATGNLIDRLVWKEVIDFIDVGIWPVFNFADSSIVIGFTLFTVLYLFSEKPQKQIILALPGPPGRMMSDKEQYSISEDERQYWGDYSNLELAQTYLQWFGGTQALFDAVNNGKVSHDKWIVCYMCDMKTPFNANTCLRCTTKYKEGFGDEARWHECEWLSDCCDAEPMREPLAVEENNAVGFCAQCHEVCAFSCDGPIHLY